MAKSLLFYNTIIPLSRDEHRKLKFKPFTDVKFAAEATLIPVAGQEFPNAALDFPILFVREDSPSGEQHFVPLVLTSIGQNKNDFVDAKGQWAQGTYIPAFVRRYPFVLGAQNPEQAGKDETYAVCVDLECGNFNEKEGHELFNDKGEPTEYTENQIAFLNMFNAEVIRTRDFCTHLAKLNVFEQQPLSIQAPDGSVATLQDFWIINPEKFSKIPVKDLEKFNKDGTLGWVFLHLASLNNLPRLMDRRITAQKANQ